VNAVAIMLVSYLGINPFIWNISIFLHHGIFATGKIKEQAPNHKASVSTQTDFRVLQPIIWSPL